MGVIYKLKDEVVQFIISQRQSNPLSSCRQLAESASQKFGLHLSKSSVHDVLKESGIITPRGRKPKEKFEIPQEKKKQIQSSLSQVKLLPDLTELSPVVLAEVMEPIPSVIPIEPSVILSEAKDLNKINSIRDSSADGLRMTKEKEDIEISPEYEAAGKIFLKAALWDLGIYSEENIKATDWDYYLTYAKGVKVVLENGNSFFIDLPLPLERCIREVADGLVNNVKPFILDKVSDEGLFKACMEAQAEFKINNISIVDVNDHDIVNLDNIVEHKRQYIIENRVFVESNEIIFTERPKSIFFSQSIDNNIFIEKTLNLRGFDSTNKNENTITLLIGNDYDKKSMLQEAAEKLNGMFLYDEQDRLVSVKIVTSS